jgi:hypothetical protein
MKRIGTYKDHCILPLLGAASNKLGSEGYLTKYNARDCVRCNLWATAEDIVRVLSARCNNCILELEIPQQHAVNASTNAQLTSPVCGTHGKAASTIILLWKLNRARDSLGQPLLI